jgi:hypothetical protein
MADFFSWVQGNWPNTITALGVIGSLWIGIFKANRENERSEREGLERMAERHGRLWAQMFAQPSLHRILHEDADISKEPLTIDEEGYINLVMAHFLHAWRLAKRGSLIRLDELAKDVRGFFPLPLPRYVWEKSKKDRNTEFVEFVERALAKRF